MELSGPHRPRSIRFLGVHSEFGWRSKIYGIAAAGTLPRQELIDATIAALGPSLPHADQQTHAARRPSHEALRSKVMWVTPLGAETASIS